jgi:HAE1 family hydrophobic/amphiphilic exporter-1
MSLSEISIRRPVFAWMLMFGLIVFGAIGFQRMGISQMPDVNFPVVNIALELENAAPEVMEMDVVDPIEDAVMGIEGLKNVTSTASHGTANITCEFELDHNIDVALSEVQDRISQARRKLPTQLYPPVITKTNPEDQPILWVMVTADPGVSLYQQMTYARNTLKGQLSTIAGVGNVVLRGYVDPNLRVWVDINKLNRYEFTSTDIINSITAGQIEQPAGRIEGTAKEFNIRVLGEAKTPKDFGLIRLDTRGGAPNFKPMPLSQVASIEEGVADIRALSRYNGKMAVGLGIVKQHGANAVEVSELVRKKLEQLRPTLLPGFHMDVQLDTTKYIRESVHELNFTLILSAILTSVICYLFLGSWSSTFNVLLAIPTSIVGAFLALYFLGFTLNTFTLLGLSLAIGIVVDDAIMMLENIVRHKEMGKSRRQAAIDGSNEITFAALAATLAIAAIFIPVIFMQGVVGRFFYQYGITVTVAVLLSLLEALTLTPMRCARFLYTPHSSDSGWVLRTMDAWMAKLERAYRKALEKTLRHRLAVVAASFLLFLGSVWMLVPMRKELIPAQDQSLFLLSIKTPVGTSIQATDSEFRKAETYLKSQPEVRDVYTAIGNYNDNDIVNAGYLYVTLVDPDKRKARQQEVMTRTRKEMSELLPNAEVVAQDLSLTGLSASRGFPIEFTIQGPDWKKLAQVSRDLMGKLKDTGLLTDIHTDFQDGMPEIDIVPNRVQAASRGMSINSMGQEVSVLMGGQVFTANTQYPSGGHRYDIRVRSEKDQHSEPSDLNKILLRNNRGEVIPISKAAEIKETTALQTISRLNRQRAIPVFANVAEGKSQHEALSKVEEVAKGYLPVGYRVAMTGSAQAFRDAFDGLVFALILGIVVAYMVLAAQFNSFIHPVTVLTALPFSLTGALISLYLTHQSINLFSMIGLILLMGIVKKNSILLVDFTNQRRSEGLAPQSALLEACPVRLRPILMTSVATVVGAVPGALALGPGAETRIPMAISIVGGVTASTFLTLFVVPCVYSLFVRFERPELEDEKAGA